MEENLQEERTYKKRFVIRLGDKMYIIRVKDIAYFISREKTTYLITHENKQYIVDQSLDSVEKYLNPQIFFRINRAMIMNIDSIKMGVRHFTGRMKLQIEPAIEDDVFVSRVRTSDFVKWIDQ